MGEATVWAQALDGRWERIGPDRVRGVWPEGLRATANDWGSDTSSFLIRRDPGAVFPDLLPFTPIDIEVAGERDWGGFVWEPPQQADERAIQVECRGWQYHTDDDLLDRLYAHSRLESWTDTRSLISANLATWQQSGSVVTGDGAVVFGFADGDDANAGEHVGVTLDLGRAEAKRVVVNVEPLNGNAAFTFIVRGHDTGDPNASFEDAITVGHETLTAGFRSGTFATPRRYVTIFLYRDDGGSGAVAADHLVRVLSALLVRDTAYESGNASILKASDAVKDLLPFCPLLDQRTDLIQASTVSLPDFVLEENTPRQGMEQANVVEGMQLRVIPERLLEYRSRPTVPILKTGGWARDALSGASRGSGEPIHNRVLVKGNDSSGGRVVVERFAAQQAGVTFEAIATPAPDNPSFDTNTTGWAASAGTLTRDTGVFDTSPASGKWDSPPSGATLTATFTGTFKRGQVYLLAVRWRTIAGPAIYLTQFGNLAAGDFTQFIAAASGSFAVLGLSGALMWMPKQDSTAVTFKLTNQTAGTLSGVYVDSLLLSVARPTIPDRRAFTRSRAIRVERPITEVLGTSMADASLRDALRTPFKGDVSATPTVVRTFLGDAPVHPAQLLRHTGELLHHGHLIDPDTGNLGRDSRLVQVAYDDEAGVSAVSIDNTRTDFETQLARYEVTGR